MSIFRVVFLGTPEFSCESLQQLINDEHYQVVGVVAQPDRKSGRNMQLRPSPVKELALKHYIPVLTPDNINQDHILNQIKEWDAEVAVVVAFGQILSQKFLDLYPQNVVNVHASLLPRWRGAAPIQRAIMAGDAVTGVCLQVMVKKLDAGAVLGSRQVELNDNKSAKQLHDELALLGGDLLHIELMDYLRGNLTPVDQDESLVTYAKKIDKSEGLIDFNLTALAIHRQVLGLSMGPGTYTFLKGKKIKIHKTQPLAAQIAAAIPGEIVELGETIKVQCGQGLLELIEVQAESRPKMLAKEYLKGHVLSIGQRFCSA